MSYHHLLSPGILKKIGEDSSFKEPVYLQVSNLKAIPSSTDRFRSRVSDGQYEIIGLFQGNCMKLIQNNTIRDFCIVKVISYSCSTVANKKTGNGNLTYAFLPKEIDPNDVHYFQHLFGNPILLDPSSSGPTKQFSNPPPSLGSSAKSTPMSTNSSVNVNQGFSAPNPGFAYSKGPQQNTKMAPELGQQSYSSTSYEVKPNPNASNPYSIKPPQQYYSSNVIQSPSSSQVITPIEHLSPYNNKWTIKVRVTSKSEMKNWSNAKGEGKLFSVNLLDESGEIKAAAFNDVADRLFNILEVDKVYTITKGAVKMANRQYSNINNDYEIQMDQNTIVEICSEGSVKIPKIRYSFCPINQIENMEKDAFIDVIGIVKECHEISSVTTKTTQKQIPKRDVVLVDTSGSSIKLTLWGSFAESFDGSNFPVMALKGVRVSDYQGRTLTALGSTNIIMGPDLPEAYQLRGWFDSLKGDHEFHQLTVANTTGNKDYSQNSNYIKLVAIKNEGLGTSEKPDFCSFKSHVSYIRSEGTISYPACPAPNCNKKVVEDGPNQWRCEKCQKVYSFCDHRYVFSINVVDSTSQQWLNVFNETGVQLLGKSAEEMLELKSQLDSEDSAAYSEVFRSVLFKPFVFKVKIKQENYNNEMKIRCSVISMSPLNYQVETKNLLSKIEKLLA